MERAKAMKKLSDKAIAYARSYGQPPYGREIEGTDELLLQMANKLQGYEDLEIQGKLLKNPQEVKNKIIDRMKEFANEYRSYSESSTDLFGGKADAMEVAIRIVKAVFSEALDNQLN